MLERRRREITTHVDNDNGRDRDQSPKNTYFMSSGAVVIVVRDNGDDGKLIRMWCVPRALAGARAGWTFGGKGARKGNGRPPALEGKREKSGAGRAQWGRRIKYPETRCAGTIRGKTSCRRRITVSVRLVIAVIVTFRIVLSLLPNVSSVCPFDPESYAVCHTAIPYQPTVQIRRTVLSHDVAVRSRIRVRGRVLRRHGPRTTSPENRRRFRRSTRGVQGVPGLREIAGKPRHRETSSSSTAL